MTEKQTITAEDAVEAGIPQKPAPEEAQVEGDTEATTAPEVDYKADAERLTQEKADLQHQLDSAMGRVKTNVSDQALGELKSQFNSLAREIRRNAVEQGDLGEVEKKQALSTLSQEDQRAKEAEGFQSYAEKLAGRINRKLDRAKLPSDNTHLKDLLSNWDNSGSIDAMDTAYEALDEFIETEVGNRTKVVADEAKNKIEEERKRANALNGTMEAGVDGTGIGAAVTDQQWMDRYADEVHGDIPGTPENAAKYKALKAKGLSPRVRQSA